MKKEKYKKKNKKRQFPGALIKRRRQSESQINWRQWAADKQSAKTKKKRRKSASERGRRGANDKDEKLLGEERQGRRQAGGGTRWHISGYQRKWVMNSSKEQGVIIFFLVLSTIRN